MTQSLRHSHPSTQCCLFVFDPMGNLFFDLPKWIASDDCPEHVHRRLLYIEPAREELVLSFNPLHLWSESR